MADWLECATDDGLNLSKRYVSLSRECPHVRWDHDRDFVHVSETGAPELVQGAATRFGNSPLVAVNRGSCNPLLSRNLAEVHGMCTTPVANWKSLFAPALRTYNAHIDAINMNHMLNRVDICGRGTVAFDYSWNATLADSAVRKGGQDDQG